MAHMRWDQWRARWIQSFDKDWAAALDGQPKRLAALKALEPVHALPVDLQRVVVEYVWEPRQLLLAYRARHGITSAVVPPGKFALTQCRDGAHLRVTLGPGPSDVPPGPDDVLLVADSAVLQALWTIPHPEHRHLTEALMRDAGGVVAIRYAPLTAALNPGALYLLCHERGAKGSRFALWHKPCAYTDQFTVPLEPVCEVSGVNSNGFAVSSDGKHLFFPAFGANTHSELALQVVDIATRSVQIAVTHRSHSGGANPEPLFAGGVAGGVVSGQPTVVWGGGPRLRALFPCPNRPDLRGRCFLELALPDPKGEFNAADSYGLLPIADVLPLPNGHYVLRLRTPLGAARLVLYDPRTGGHVTELARSRDRNRLPVKLSSHEFRTLCCDLTLTEPSASAERRPLGWPQPPVAAAGGATTISATPATASSASAPTATATPPTASAEAKTNALTARRGFMSEAEARVALATVVLRGVKPGVLADRLSDAGLRVYNSEKLQRRIIARTRAEAATFELAALRAAAQLTTPLPAAAPSSSTASRSASIVAAATEAVRADPKLRAQAAAVEPAQFPRSRGALNSDGVLRISRRLRVMALGAGQPFGVYLIDGHRIRFITLPAECAKAHTAPAPSHQ